MTEIARITVIAGVNGAGKSSVVGELLRKAGGEYFNPDEVTQKMMSKALLAANEANGRAWEEGRRRLEQAIERRTDYTFETTLGGTQITELLFRALDARIEVAMLYVGLQSVELHLDRVRSRVEAGGHDIPQSKIRQRYTSSMKNLVKLAPRLFELRVFDNSAEADPKAGQEPEPKELIYAKNGRLARICELELCPDWAKPVVAILLRAT